jgi:hypothetical protein
MSLSSRSSRSPPRRRPPIDRAGHRLGSTRTPIERRRRRGSLPRVARPRCQRNFHNRQPGGSMCQTAELLVNSAGGCEPTLTAEPVSLFPSRDDQQACRVRTRRLLRSDRLLGGKRRDHGSSSGHAAWLRMPRVDAVLAVVRSLDKHRDTATLRIGLRPTSWAPRPSPTAFSRAAVLHRCAATTNRSLPREYRLAA